MKYFLLLIIKIYWKIIPENKRRTCIYKISCSHFVYNQTVQNGFVKGISALFYRYKNCQSGYFIFKIKDKLYVKTVDNQVIIEEDLSEKVKNEAKKLVF